MRLSCYWSWVSSSNCQSSCGSTRLSPRGSAVYFDNVMTKFMINNRTNALKTDINLFFTITNCRIAGSRSLTRRKNFKFMCLPVGYFLLSIYGQTHEFQIHATLQRARAGNSTICYRKKQIDVSFLCVCPVIDDEFRHQIVKVVVDPRGDSRMYPQTTLTMLWRNSWSITLAVSQYHFG